MPADDTGTWQRREFMRASGSALVGLGLIPLVGAARAARARIGPPGRSLDPDRASALPPRTVGLRTLGGDFRFDPAGLRVEKGDRVIWLNMGDFHTASAFHPDNSNLISGDVPLRIPEEAEPWHSGTLGLDAGTEFEHAFGVEGVYDYFCQPHYSFGMVGRIIVGSPQGGPAVARPIAELNEASRRQMPPVETIMGPNGRTYEWASRINGVLLLRAHGESGESIDAAARAVRTGASGDRELQNLLRSAGIASEFEGRLDAFLEGAASGLDYEMLVDRADAAKDALARAHRQA